MEWISVKDKLPPVNITILFGHKHYIDIGIRNEEDELWCVSASLLKSLPTHWMPLPEKPNET